jgi:hypothetical protein
LVRVVGIASIATSGWGCQILGGVDGDLVLSVAGGGPVGVAGEPLTWEASDPGQGANPVYDLPGWLTFRNYSENLTSQHGATLKTGYGLDAPRPRNVNGTWGLAVEKSRTNHVVNSAWKGAGWLPGQPAPMSVSPGEEDPAEDDPAFSGVRFDSKGEAQSNAMPVPEPGAIMASTWARGVGSSERHAYFAFGDNWANVDSEQWERYAVPYIGGDKLLRFETQGFGPAPIETPTAVIAYGAQVEEGRYPSSFIPTNGAPRLREADVLGVKANRVAPSGWFAVTIRFAPHYAMGEMDSVHDIINLYRNQIFVRLQRDQQKGVGVVLLQVPGSDSGVTNLKIEGLDWKRNQPLTVVAWSSPAGRFLSIEGADTGNGEVSSDVPANPLADPGADLSRILGEKNGAQESADLQYIQFR